MVIFWCVETQPFKKKKKKLTCWTWKTPAFPQKSPLLRLLPIDVLFIKGLVHLAVQVSCSTLSPRTGQDLKSIHTAHWDLLCCSISVLLTVPPQQCCSLRSASVPAWLWDSWRTGDILEWKQQLSTSCWPLQRLERTELLRRELVDLKSLVSLINKYWLRVRMRNKTLHFGTGRQSQLPPFSVQKETSFKTFALKDLCDVWCITH